MKSIDTNVLVRYLVQDDVAQSKKATQFIEKEYDFENTIFISSIVLCELIWVLESAYEYPKKIIADVLEKILRTRQFSIENPDITWLSLHDYRTLNIDFSDGYIAHLNAANQCEYTVTFDKKALRLKQFRGL